MEYLRLNPGFRTALADGVLVPDSPKHMATEELYYAVPGSKIYLNDDRFLFVAAEFSLERKQEYIYTYAYQAEENWTTYTRNVAPDTYQSEEYIFEKECYFRVCVKRADGEDMEEKDMEAAGEIVCFQHKEMPYQPKDYLEAEIRDTINKIAQTENTGAMKLCLLTDTHYTVNGTWKDTAYCIQETAKKADYDGIIHLGDLTDGMVSKYMTCKYVKQIITDLEKAKSPVYITPGNHDSNYFRNEKNMFSLTEMRDIYCLYGKDAEGKKAENTEGLDYYVDIPEHRVRMIFLSSFNHKAAIRYGYEEHQLVWLEQVLADTPKGSRLLIFSHDASLAKLDYWSFLIRNGEGLLDILEKYNAKEDYQIIGFFYGHTHADYVWEECSFPVVSIGCSKLEYFTDKKPAGARAWSRKADDVSQELWDSLIIDFEKQIFKMVRFGAGEDREVSFAKKESIYKENIRKQRKERHTKIWAHRGASGRAPENTMPAFQLAYELGANGIELDVQLTKDGVPVVIHDERVDRVCDGTGWVKDHTLEELQKLNANKSFPAYGKVSIPTLAEFYEWVKDTDLIINLELKNSQIFYEKLEEKVIKLAREYDIEDRLIYSSFNHYSMRKIRKLKSDAKIAFLYSNGILNIAEYAKKHGADAVHPSLLNMDYPGVDIVKECHASGIKVHVWTVNDKTDIERMRQLDVDAVITNYVELGTED